MGTLTLLAASTMGVPTCEECKTAIDGLVARLTGAASVEEQTAILIVTVCPQGIAQVWGEIANVMYPVFLEATKVCTILEVCKLRDWSCEECQGGIAKIAEVIKSPEQIAEIVTFLQGDDFCGKHPEATTCPD